MTCSGLQKVLPSVFICQCVCMYSTCAHNWQSMPLAEGGALGQATTMKNGMNEFNKIKSTLETELDSHSASTLHVLPAFCGGFGPHFPVVSSTTFPLVHVLHAPVLRLHFVHSLSLAVHVCSKQKAWCT